MNKEISPAEQSLAQKHYRYNNLARWNPTTISYAKRGALAEFQCFFFGHSWQTYWSDGVDEGIPVAKGWRHCPRCNYRELAEIYFYPKGTKGIV